MNNSLFNILLAALLLLCFSSVNAGAQNFEWAKSTGSIDVDAGASIVTDLNGNIYTTGRFQGSVDFDPGPGVFYLNSGTSQGIFISKMDAFGNFLWVKSMSGAWHSSGYSIDVDSSGNIYSTGYFAGTVDFDPGAGVYNLSATGNGYDIFISKLDASGNFLWAKAIGGSGNYDVGHSIVADNSGNVYTAGYFSGTVDFDPGPGVFNLSSAGQSDIFIIKLDSSGNFVWAHQIGGSIGDWSYSITLDAAGNVYTTGNYQGTVDFDPGPGVFNLSSYGSIDVFVLKLDSAGNFIWARGMGGSDQDQSNGIAVDEFNNIYTVGSFKGIADFDPGPGTFNLTSMGQTDIFISKLDSSGNFLWARSFGGIDNDFGYSIALDFLGNVYTSGSFRYTVDFDPGPGIYNLTAALSGVFISKLDTYGDFVWGQSMGGASTGNDGISVTIDNSGNVITTGAFTNTVDFDPGPGIFNLTSNGSTDIFIHKMSQCTPPVLSTTVTQPLCNETTGSATINTSGGTAPYTYTWSSSHATASVTGLLPGTYTVTVTDSTSCAAVVTITITQPPVIASNEVITHPLCSGNTGAITLSPGNGTPPYSYSWSNNATTSAISGINGGKYTVTITDSTGCIRIDSFNIVQPSALAIAPVSTNALCNGGTGSIYSNASGGTPPFNYIWNTGSTTHFLDGVPAGNYTLTLTDNNGCSDVFSATITEPDTLTAILVSTTSQSTTNCTGTAIANTTGGTAPYAYSWSNGSSGNFIDNLCPGTYYVTITDANTCSYIDSVTVSTAVGLADILRDGRIKIYPNPGNGIFILETSEEQMKIIVYDALGEIILRRDLINSKYHTIDLFGYAAGIYLLIIETEGQQLQIEKLVISR